MLLPFNNYKTMEWKNKRGVTQEIIRYPEQSNMHDFEWRFSSAQFDASGPFSKFDGYDRILILLEGSFIKLDHNQVSLIQLLPQEIYKFSGSIDTSCQINENVRDLNLIYKQNNWDVSFQQITLKNQDYEIQANQFILIFCFKGSVKLKQSNNQSIEINKYDSALFQNQQIILYSEFESVLFQFTLKQLNL